MSRDKIDRRLMRRSIGEAAVTSFEHLGTRLDLDEAKLTSHARLIEQLQHKSDSQARSLDLARVHIAELRKFQELHERQVQAFIMLSFWQRLRWLFRGHVG